MLTAGSTDRILGSWGVQAQDPNDYFNSDGDTINNRGQWAYDNDPIVHAIVESLLDGTLGANGLQHRSAFQADDSDTLTDTEIAVRKSVRRSIQLGTRGTSFDAGGLLTRPQMSKVILSSTIINGIGVSFRTWNPTRPGRNSHATCWRIVHPARISNRNFGPNTARQRDGFILDDNGTPIGITVQRTHPASTAVAPQHVWDTYPIYDKQGYRAVTIHSLPRHADQIRPTGWFTPVMQLLRLFGRTIEAKVIADTIKASMGLIVECDNPEAMARADRNGAILNGSTKIIPGKCYYVKKGTVWKELNFQYNGQDFDKWQEVILTNICAAFGMPYEYVQRKLTRSNMASSRVALMQAYRTFHGHQQDLINSTEEPWNQSLIREDIARGRISGFDLNDPDMLDRVLVGRYLRPARFMPDPAKEANAASLLVKELGVSLDTVYGDLGLDTEQEWTARAQNNAELQRRGITLGDVDENNSPAPTPNDNSTDDDEIDPSANSPTPTT